MPVDATDTVFSISLLVLITGKERTITSFSDWRSPNGVDKREKSNRLQPKLNQRSLESFIVPCHSAHPPELLTFHSTSVNQKHSFKSPSKHTLSLTASHVSCIRSHGRLYGGLCFRINGSESNPELLRRTLIKYRLSPTQGFWCRSGRTFLSTAY